MAVSTGSDLLLSPIGQAPPSPGVGALLCCASTAGAPITPNNAALPGETILVYATGLGLPALAPNINPYLLSGQIYQGPAAKFPQNFVSGQINNSTVNVIHAELAPGMIGIYQMYLNLDASLATDRFAELYIAQNTFRSNVVTVPVFATPVLSSVTCNPSTVTSGSTTSCTVALTVPPPTGLTTVTLSTSDSVNFPVPSSIVIPAGTTERQLHCFGGKRVRYRGRYRQCYPGQPDFNRDDYLESFVAREGAARRLIQAPA